MIARRLVDEMIAHARQEAPDECCGFLAGTGDRVAGVFPCVNGVEPADRPFRYLTESRSLLQAYRAIDERGWEPLGIYHSHTHTQPYPSPTDIGIHGESQMPDSFVYLLVSLRTARQPFVYRGMSHEQWQRAHTFAQTQPAEPEVCAFHIRDGRAEQIELQVTEE